jgi:hypothetical protein
MRFSARLILIAAMLGVGITVAVAASNSLDQWFSQATGLSDKDVTGTVQHIATADYMCGKTFDTTCKVTGTDSDVLMTPFLWSLHAYDRTHHIGLAWAGTDQIGRALFKAAPPPGVSVPDKDLSQYGTGRGLRIGSTYSQVLALYGPPVMHGQHFVTWYGATDTVYYKGKPEYYRGKLKKQSEIITLVIDGGRVSSITIAVQLWEGF